MATKKRKTTLKAAREKEAKKYQKRIAELEAQQGKTAAPIDETTSKEESIEEKAKKKVITLYHKFRPNALRFSNYIKPKPEYGYYWHDIGMVERQGWGIWERVDKSNHEGCILPTTRVHADGSIRVGTAFMCYAPKEDVLAKRMYEQEQTDKVIPGLKEAYLEEAQRIQGSERIGKAFIGEGIEEKQMRY